MQVTVKFFAFFRQITGVDHLSVVLAEGATIAELLNLLSRKFDNLSFESERPVIMVNHTNALPQTILKEGDNVLLLPVLEGG
ncbi:MAG: MoaD/ThiS family protein [Syntrophales bacterium]